MIQIGKTMLAAAGCGKKTVLAAIFLGAAGFNLGAQGAGPVGSGQIFQMDAKSVQSQYSASRFANVVDNYLNVVNWQVSGVDGFFGFLGGSGGAQNSNFKLGLAKAVNSGILGVYFSGDLLSGEGMNGQVQGSRWTLNDNLTVIWGNNALGGLRFDAIFAGSSFSSDDTGSVNQPFITTFQWGGRIPVGEKRRVRPSIAAGMKWAYSGTGDFSDRSFTVHGGDGTGSIVAPTASSIPAGEGAAYVKLAVIVDNLESGWSYAADYALTAGLGSEKETKASGVTLTEKQSGALWHTVNVFAVKTITPVDKLSLILRPNLQAGLYSWQNGTSADFVNRNSNELAFEIKPGLQIGLRYTLKNNAAFYTGITLTLLDYQYINKDSGANNPVNGDAWRLSGLTIAGGSNLGLAMTLTPAPGFSVELGVRNQTIAPTKGEFSFDVLKWEGSLLVRFQSLPKTE